MDARSRRRYRLLHLGEILRLIPVQLDPGLWAQEFGTSLSPRLIVALIGGVFMGFGSRWAGGCTSGHGISGTLQLAVSSWIVAVCLFLGGIITAKLIFILFA